jgi:hypothetical protein
MRRVSVAMFAVLVGVAIVATADSALAQAPNRRAGARSRGRHHATPEVRGPHPR